MVTHGTLSAKLRNQRGFSLIELVCVIVIIAILGAIATRTLDSSVGASRQAETQQELDRLARAMVGSVDITTPGGRVDFGYVGDNGALPATLGNLVINPGGWTTWKGPYIRDNFSENASDYATDPWGASYAYSGVSIVSSGSGANITKQLANSSANLLSNTVQGVILDQNGTPPGTEKSVVFVKITYPNGSGALTTQTVNPNSSGSFSFLTVPMGIQPISVVYATANDTVSSYVTVYPRAGGYAGALRFGTDHWVDAVGGGGGGGVVSYVNGTGLIKVSRKHIEFQVRNTGSAAVAISWIKITWSAASAFPEVGKLAGATYFNNTCNKFSSGDTLVISPSYSLAVNATATIELSQNKTTICGNSNSSIADNTSYTAVFSNGNTITFTVVQ